MEYMVDQSSGYDKVGFIRRDLHNSFARDRVISLNGFGAESLIAHFKTKMQMDLDIFFYYTVE